MRIHVSPPPCAVSKSPQKLPRKVRRVPIDVLVSVNRHSIEVPLSLFLNQHKSLGGFHFFDQLFRGLWPTHKIYDVD